MNTKFSFYKRANRRIKPLKSITISNCYQNITGRDNKIQTDFYRLLVKEKDREADYYKQDSFDFVTFSGIFLHRKPEELIEHSGLICLKFYHIPGYNVSSLKEKIIRDQDLELALCFTTTSGTGLNVVLGIDMEGGSHREWFEALTNYFATMYNIAPDQSGADVCSRCFIPYDPGAFIGLNYRLCIQW